MFSNYSESGSPLLGLDRADAKCIGTFRFSGRLAHTVIANTLRRVILTSTRSVGFTNDTIIRKNTSVIPNEMLSHRISMIPLAVRKFDGFDPTKWRFDLKVANTARDSSSLIHVKASDFRVLVKNEVSGEFEEMVGGAKSIFPPNPISNDTCLIATLKPQSKKSDNPEQEIDLSAFIAVGTAKSQANVAFSPVCQCTFSNTLDTDKARREQFFNSWISVAKKIDDPSTLTEELRANLLREWNTLEIQRCFLIDEKGEPNSFDFTIESVGIRPVKEIVAEGFRVVIDMLKPYSDETKSLSEMNITMMPSLNRMENGWDLVFNGQEHTLGALLQYIMSESFMESSLSFVGYKVAHPLELKMTLRLGFKSEANEELVRSLVIRAAEGAIKIFTELEKEWDLNVGNGRM